ncbi:MAG TPA: peptide chain release factor aRF-1 [Candidatus Nanoarchaeia archaeon]|nr:peptide chain release factor aRF-1 [Candidatus Nanoarchaeia archaeon]
MDPKKHFQLRKFVNELKAHRARHTEFISVYVPVGYDLIKIIQHLAEEQGTAANIKDKTTRKNVQDALEKMIRHLRVYARTPENGVAVFCGNVSEQEGKQDLQVWSIEPPLPINIRLYRCDQTFVLEPLERMVQNTEIYGLLVLDNREATIGLLKGKVIQVVKDFSSLVPGKVKVGGWSQQRYARLREEAANEFYKRVAEVANVEFANVGKELKGIIIGGPGPTKETFYNTDHLHTELKKKVLGIKDIAYTDEQGLHELVDKASDLLAEAELIKEKKIVGDFLGLLAKNSDKALYGPNDVLKALDMGAVDKLLISENFAKMDEFEEKAGNTGAEVFLISVDTSEGGQIKELGGVAAILRYAVNL